MGRKTEAEYPTKELQEIAKTLKITFNTVRKVYDASKNWRNCEVRGIRVRDEIKRKLTL